jgi:type II secretion system protein G
MKKLIGFTLIEMLVVIAILGIIATVLFATINPVAQLQKTNDAHRKSDLENVQRALDLYYQDNGSYPASSASFQIAPGGTAIAWGSAWSTYMSKLPKDPIAANTYVYYSPTSSNGQAYYLYANLQQGAHDPNACNNGSACTSMSGTGFPSTTACGGTCNYGVTSTNVSP